jgi:hypothetical protein
MTAASRAYDTSSSCIPGTDGVTVLLRKTFAVRVRKDIMTRDCPRPARELGWPCDVEKYPEFESALLAVERPA